MARKEPFKRISVSDRIYEALDARRREETKDEFRPLPMNSYAEKILWDYAQGKLPKTLSGVAGPTSVEEISSQSVLQGLFEKEPKDLTGEEVEMILELGRRAQQKLDLEEELSRPRKKKSA